MSEPFIKPEFKQKIIAMSPGMFWAMVFLVWMLSQIPVINLPFAFLATWVHELGHGLGALIMGGTFENFLVRADFAGLAKVKVDSDVGRVVMVLMGLLGPSFVGGIMLIMTRAFSQARIAVCIISVGLLLSAVLWADDTFTRTIVISLGIGLGAIAGWGSMFAVSFVSYTVSIALCLNAISHITYYFVQAGNVGDQSYQSDTAVLTSVLGGPHILWAMVVTVSSLAILFISFRLSGVLGARKR